MSKIIHKEKYIKAKNSKSIMAEKIALGIGSTTEEHQNMIRFILVV